MRLGLTFVILVSGVPLAWGGGYYATSVETDKTVYELGETASITHTIFNPSEEAVYIFLHTSPGFDILVYDNPGDLTGGELYLTRDPICNIIKGQRQMFRQFWLLPGEFVEDQASWDLVDNDEQPLVVGEYGIVESFGHASTRITIIPEPSALLGFAIAAGIFCSRRRRRVIQ